MGDGDSTGILLIMMMCCCALIVAAAGGYYWYTEGGGKETLAGAKKAEAGEMDSASLAALAPAPIPSLAPAPAPADPKAALQATGQAIQVAEVDISTAPPAFTVPTGVPTTGAVTYTMTMDVNIAQTAPGWRNVMNHGASDAVSPTTRRPSVFITGNDAAPPNRIHVVHGATEDDNKNIITTFAATPGTYFTLTWVVDAGTMTVYVNGTKDATGTATGTFTWLDAAQPWNWIASTPGAVKVKNAYWFNKALTAAEVTTLATAAASGTSTYRPEPISYGYLTEAGPSVKPAPNPQAAQSFEPEPITASGGDYMGLLE